MSPESPEIFFRQLLIVHEFIFYRLDRPMLPPRMWPEAIGLNSVAKKSERYDFMKYELLGICRHALRKAWETAYLLGLENI